MCRDEFRAKFRERIGHEIAEYTSYDQGQIWSLYVRGATLDEIENASRDMVLAPPERPPEREEIYLAIDDALADALADAALIDNGLTVDDALRILKKAVEHRDGVREALLFVAALAVGSIEKHIQADRGKR
jgi:hypothetical protein